MSVRAKICGIRSEDDLAIAVAAGADAVGFISGITHRSEDELDANVARALSRLVPPYVTRVLVTHLQDANEILRLADRVEADAIQVHGEVSLETVQAVVVGANGRQVIKAVHVTSGAALSSAVAAADICGAVHLDSRTEDRLGGTGRTHDWSVSAAIVQALAERRCHVILAGGLTPANLAEAMSVVGPFAVDANSGLEDDRGDKSESLCNAFVSLAHSGRNLEGNRGDG
ncbi:phosphoribosylanthranilate isomerase [Aldersonia sp. NBC_00410]|uniref:phosphoribosylanthranilate isomerase n=1 Tax=Aldersonia sp. NBC_00410 TaxID=2975954 RepID=UPI002254DE1B|nr:phosphoribosylanthranilate isomerase [Aldersonia sp. NBC_00410]MCX5046385.1 phosphoribosylanthranilate isomerase [Aldersonia sp. NBC_00410]